MSQTADDAWSSLKCEVCGTKDWLVYRMSGFGPQGAYALEPAQTDDKEKIYVCKTCGNSKRRTVLP